MSNVSAVFSLHEETKGRLDTAYYVRQGINGLAVAFQLIGFVSWAAVHHDELRGFVLAMSLILISCGWWENFFTATNKPGKQDKITIQLHYSLPPATFPPVIQAHISEPEVFVHNLKRRKGI